MLANFTLLLVTLMTFYGSTNGVENEVKTFVLPSPIKCAKHAPYNLNKATTKLAVWTAVTQGMNWYAYRLGIFIDNAKSLPPSQVDAAVDHFMEVFCEPPYFKGFIGITNDGVLITNRTEVRELYKAVALSPNTLMPFNDKVYNVVPRIHEDDDVSKNGNRRVVYANATAFFELVTRTPNPDGSINYLSVFGWYEHEWRINAHGNICISAFSESVRNINILLHVDVLNLPWDKDIE